MNSTYRRIGTVSTSPSRYLLMDTHSALSLSFFACGGTGGGVRCGTEYSAASRESDDEDGGGAVTTGGVQGGGRVKDAMWREKLKERKLLLQEVRSCVGW